MNEDSQVGSAGRGARAAQVPGAPSLPAQSFEVSHAGFVMTGGNSVRTLREWRTSRLMSVRELAAEAGITAKTLTDIEHGRRNPTYESMRGVCKVLGVDATQIAEFVATIAVRSKRHTPGT